MAGRRTSLSQYLSSFAASMSTSLHNHPATNPGQVLCPTRVLGLAAEEPTLAVLERQLPESLLVVPQRRRCDNH